MDGIEAKMKLNPPPKTFKYSTVTQISLRFFATVASLSAALILLISKQKAIIYSVPMEAQYRNSPTSKYLLFANFVAFGFSVASLVAIAVLARTSSNRNHYFYMFLHDLILTSFLMSACAAASAIGHVSRYGNTHTGWLPICDHFAWFCSRVTISVVLSYLAFFFYLLLTIISANKFRQVQA